ncbi:multicopy suppressor of BFA (Brefeldin A) [Coemansia sp. RSA 1807]|nr:multicopy suppressor of BFA (Brefeldin A) [Coemansia sp. RSA 564]KAJ2281890.1 multicopy suppressor of BFA (Brefeldin A) [Coemansia sp. RSA 451]KAJ2409405.1 multicopy suppressor of BFA (Brefeldin A) [Coemansia sp. RSA 2526]KAJ2533976.1 multicopy suppressor of BFA (Brefeldin A) [Coemansia sp. RSA 1937]KAJ2577633.1 multicopy suppressor of BFA (Brefeldin A) [Coemansia sp. RSA 1807]KAJ2726383.1 multicopy suppressor of BFA (Brefeldin A) [Coemansia sp. D1744]
MAPELTTQTQDEPRIAASVKKARPSRPDDDKYRQDLANIDAEINKLRKEQDSLKETLGKTDPRKGPFADKRNKLVARLQEIRTEQSGLRKSRGKVFDKQASLTAAISKNAAELKAQQAKLTYKSVEEIDEAIAQKEKQIESGKLRIVEEKRLANEIASQRRARKLVEQAAKLQKTIDADVAELAEVDAQLGDTNAQALSDEHEQLQSELDGLKASQEQGHQKRNELFDERTRIMKALDDAWNKKRALQDEFRQQKNSFFHWQQDERKRRAQEEKQQRIQEQREKRLALAQDQREEAELPAFQEEISSCDTLIAYLASLQPAAGSGSRSEGSTRPSSAASNARAVDANEHVPAGMVAVKKATGNDDMYFAGTAKNKKKHARKDKAGSTKADALKLPLGVAESLLHLQITIPTSTSAIAATVDKLAARKQHFVDRQPTATAENKKKAEEKIAKLMAELDMDEKIAA